MSRAVVALVLLLGLWTAGLPAVRQTDGVPSGWAGLRVLVEALADAFGPTEHEPGFDGIRAKMARGALVPSHVFDDAAAWMTRGADWRAFDLTGVMTGSGYRVGFRAEAPRPALPGQYRSRVRLQRLASGRFEWTVRDELAIGRARSSDLVRAVEALFRGAEKATESSARAALTRALPRASAQFGRLFRLETLTLRPDASGSTSVRLAVRVVPDGIRGSAPRHAAFLDTHATPIRLSLVVGDPGGVRWWTLEAADNLWTLRLRLRDGSLVPLEGPADRRIPERLRATADAATRLGRFGVGARRVAMDVALVRTPGEKAFAVRFLEEPDWQLPFLVETILDSPLHYPFEAPGSEVGWTARDTAGGGVLERRYRARVRESWILRWLSGMANDAVGTFRDGAEREADRYHRACLLALRDDLAALDAAPSK